MNKVCTGSGIVDKRERVGKASIVHRQLLWGSIVREESMKDAKRLVGYFGGVKAANKPKSREIDLPMPKTKVFGSDVGYSKNMHEHSRKESEENKRIVGSDEKKEKGKSK